MSRNPLHQRLMTIVEPVCEAAGYELVELRFLLEQGGWVLRVCVDLPLADVDPTEVPSERVDLSDCENVSRELSAVLDVNDPIPQAYSLEVSSPGIDRPLRTAAHFAHFAGSEAKIQLDVPLHTATGERRNFRGILAGVADDEGKPSAPGGAASAGARVKINVDGQLFELPIGDIEHAKLVPDWDAVMKGKSGVGGRADGEAKPVKPGHRPRSSSRAQARGGAKHDKPPESGGND